MVLSAESLKYFALLCEKCAKLKLTNNSKEETDELTLINLLGGVSSSRRSPGIEENMGHKGYYVCKTEEDKKLTIKFMKDVFAIDSAEKLEKTISWYSTNMDYRDFYDIWNGYSPEFVSKLEGDGLEGFNKCKSYAEELSKYTGARGFLAWDISENIGVLRRAYACGLLPKDRFDFLAKRMWAMAAEYFDDWGEFAISCVCGATYYEYKYSRCDVKKANNFLKMNMEIVLRLVDSDGLWNQYAWPQRKGAIPKIKLCNLIRMMPSSYKGPMGCLLSKKVYIDGEEVNVVKRQEPSAQYKDLDSGWIIGSGTETNEYLSDPNNMALVDLNTACNYSPDLVKVFKADTKWPVVMVRESKEEWKKNNES